MEIQDRVVIGTFFVRKALLNEPVMVIGILEKNMRKMVFAFAALAAFGLTLPLASTTKAEAGIVVVKTGERDQNHDRRWHRDRDHRKVVMIKTGDRDQNHDRRWHRDRDHRKVVIIKKHRYRDYDND